MTFMPTIFALRVITAIIALGLFVSWALSPRPKHAADRWESNAWGFMCLAVLCFSLQFFLVERLGLPIQHPMRQAGIGTALVFMWPSFQCARASAIYRRGGTGREVKADQIVTIALGFLVIAICNILFLYT